MATSRTPVLTDADKAHFLEHGWIKIPGAFEPSAAKHLVDPVWTRLGMDPADKSTWHTLRTNMPSHNDFDAAEFAPRAWSAIVELLTPKNSSFAEGESLISKESKIWHDSLIVNLGSPETEGKPDHPWNLKGWHVDGDFFVHYLNSQEQALLVIPLFTDIPPQGGGTALMPAGIGTVAKHLYEHPEGVSPRMVPRANGDFTKERNLDWFNNVIMQNSNKPEEFVEASGKTGDVFLLHPLMLHSATNNSLRNVRIITNPPVSLTRPFNFDREDGGYSLVEQKTLKALGKDRLKGWKPTMPREQVIPERVRIQARLKEEEKKRLEAEKKLKEQASQQAQGVSAAA